MQDSARMKQSHAINFVVANIAYYKIIHSMAWLQKQNLNINWDSAVWH
jgi:hypothetical protein